MSFSKIGRLITTLTRDPVLLKAVSTAVGPRVSVGQARSWERLVWLIRERPVTGVVLDTWALPEHPAPHEVVSDLSTRFSSLATVMVARPGVDAGTLLRLGRVGITELNLIDLDGPGDALNRALGRARSKGTEALVLRAVGIGLSRVGRRVLRSALEGALLGWRADDLAADIGFTRAHLSVLLRRRGLPSAGRLLLWARLMHAGRWLAEPGRSAESVSRQLEYANGAVFRRALRNYLGTTPTAVREGGGLALVLQRFLDVCGLGGSVEGAALPIVGPALSRPHRTPWTQGT